MTRSLLRGGDLTVPAMALSLLVLPFALAAQDRPDRFERREEPTEVPATVFHSTQGFNLPTAETLGRGEFLFEISHRFLPPLSRGADALWGLDGPIFNRLGLAYAVTDRVMVGALRSNLDDNLELNGKVRLLERDSGPVPVMVGAMAGVAWNTDAPVPAGAEENESQLYAELILNARLGEPFAVGLVPAFIRNPRIRSPDADNAFVLGVNGQWYLTDVVSLLGEWIVSEDRPGLAHDGGSFGIEFETGGHFFKVLLTNQSRTNPTQVLGGTPYDFTADEWRLGFNITRVLAF